MFAGGFFSFVAEMSAVALNWYLTGHGIFFTPIYSTDPTPTDLTIFWSLMPLAAFSPVIVVLVGGWIRRILRRGGNGETPLTIPEQIAKTIGEGNLRQTLEIANRGPEAAALVGQALEDHFRERAAGYRQAAQMMREEEEREEADAKIKRELETDLLDRLDTQITRMKEQPG